MVSKNDLKQLLSFSVKLTRVAGLLLLKKQNKAKIVKFKDNKDIATSADMTSEKFIIESILKKFPSHGIISEESGEINNGSDFNWIIDPLDGTKEYIRRIPLWNVSIALEHKGKLIVSAINRPFEKRIYSAANGLGSFLNGMKIKVSAINKLKDSFVYCYLPSFHRQKENYDKAFESISKIGKVTYRLRSLADENTACCWLAQGGIEAYLNISNPPKWHDIAPGIDEKGFNRGFQYSVGNATRHLMGDNIVSDDNNSETVFDKNHNEAAIGLLNGNAKAGVTKGFPGGL